MKALAQVTIPSPQTTGLDPRFSSLGVLASEVLKYALVIGGLSMFVFIILGGFNLLTSSGNPEGIKKGTSQVVFAIIGFLIIFAAYWIIQIVEVIFGLTIL